MFLSKDEIEYFENFIDSLSDEDKDFNVCEECGEILGFKFDANNYIYLQDTGICKICMKKKEVINPKIAFEISKRKISPFDYFYSNCRRLAR